MRRSSTLFSVLALSLALTFAAAQGTTAVKRVVILPFDTDAAVSPYQLGLPTALQHALNQLPGTYVPRRRRRPRGQQGRRRAGRRRRDRRQAVRRQRRRDGQRHHGWRRREGGAQRRRRWGCSGAPGAGQRSRLPRRERGRGGRQGRLARRLERCACQRQGRRRADPERGQPRPHGPGGVGSARRALGRPRRGGRAGRRLGVGGGQYARTAALEGDLETAVAAAKRAVALAPDDAEVRRPPA